MSVYLKVGVIGVGHWGPNVLRNFLDHPRVRVAMVCDISETAIKNISNLLPSDCQIVSNSKKVIDSKDIDAVAVVTPTPTHYEIVKSVLQSGKHVLCEKPLAMSINEDEDLHHLARSKGLRLMVGYTFLFNNAVLKIKSMVEEKLLGKVYYLTAKRTHMGLIRENESVIWDLAPHDISIMNYLLGETPAKVSAVGAKPLGKPFFDVGFINLFYPTGAMGHIHVSWVDSNKERQVSAIGSQARVLFDDLNCLEPVRLYQKGVGVSDQVKSKFGEFSFLLRDGDIISPKIHMEEPLTQMIGKFVELVMDGSESLGTGKFVQNITRVLVAVEHSMASDGVLIDV